MDFVKSISQKILNLRLEKGISQTELARRAGLTKGYISQLERGRVSPRIDTLREILKSLGVNLKDFFEEEEEKSIVFDSFAHIDLAPRSTRLRVLLLTPLREKAFDIYYIEFLPGMKTLTEEPHPGEEGGYVIQGEITMRYGNKEIVVKRGESYSFKCDRVHYFRNSGDTKAVFINIVSPPYPNILIG